MIMNIVNVLANIKSDFESAVTSATFNGRSYPDGLSAKEALIRSQRIINLLHEFVKHELVACGVNSTKIYPGLGSSNGEVALPGFLKKKQQDIAVIPVGTPQPQGNAVNPRYERILSVNVRSQLSSMAKNIDTLYERTFAEALNLHLSYPTQCLGEVYLIPTNEYDDKPMVHNRIAFKATAAVERYVEMFQAINGRSVVVGDEYKYERVCLLIVDFRSNPPKLYSDITELKRDGIVPPHSKVTMNKLTVKNFVSDLLAIYGQRFQIADLH